MQISSIGASVSLGNMEQSGATARTSMSVAMLDKSLDVQGDIAASLIGQLMEEMPSVTPNKVDMYV